jgi:hypothetical protein
VRNVAEADLDDIGGDRRSTFEGIEGQFRLLPRGDRNDHGFPDRPRHAEQIGRSDAGKSARDDDLDGRLQAGEAEGIGAFAQLIGDSAHRVLGDRDDIGQDHDPHDYAGNQEIEASEPGNETLEQRGQEQKREIAECHRRHAGDELEHGFRDLSHASTGELAQIDGEDGPGGNRDEQCDQRGHHGTGDQRHDAETRDLEDRRPLRVGEEFHDRDMREELHALPEQHIDDAGRHQHRNRGGDEQDHAHRMVNHAAAQEKEWRNSEVGGPLRGHLCDRLKLDGAPSRAFFGRGEGGAVLCRPRRFLRWLNRRASP